MIKWGILGTGKMAATLTNALKNSPECEVVAVGSRNQSSADEFARKFGIAKAYGSYEALYEAPEPDIIYIASTNNLHLENAVRAMEAGKHVLVEKPFTLNEAQAYALVDVADEKACFCMEAMWMRFLPLMRKVEELVKSGAIGKLKMITANFGGQVPFSERSRHYDPKLGGGSLLDLLIYPISLTHMLLGEPDEISSQSVISASGVDEQTSAILHYKEAGALANLQASFSTNLANEVYLYGDKGSIKIHAPMYRPHELSLQRFSSKQAVVANSMTANSVAAKPVNGSQGFVGKLKNNRLMRSLFFKAKPVVRELSESSGERIVLPFYGSGYEHQIAAVVACIKAKQTECETMSLAASIEVMKIADTIRQQQQITFPQEN